MEPERDQLSRLIALKGVLMAAGGAGFVLFGLTGAMLADAGWKRVGNVISPLAIICWCAAAIGACIHAYDFLRRK